MFAHCCILGLAPVASKVPGCALHLCVWVRFAGALSFLLLLHIDTCVLDTVWCVLASCVALSPAKRGFAHMCMSTVALFALRFLALATHTCALCTLGSMHR